MAVEVRMVKQTHEQSGDVSYALASVFYDKDKKIAAVSPTHWIFSFQILMMINLLVMLSSN
jgi:hypothetical protein